MMALCAEKIAKRVKTPLFYKKNLIEVRNINENVATTNAENVIN